MLQLYDRKFSIKIIDFAAIYSNLYDKPTSKVIRNRGKTKENRFKRVNPPYCANERHFF